MEWSVVQFVVEQGLPFTAGVVVGVIIGIALCVWAAIGGGDWS